MRSLLRILRLPRPARLAALLLAAQCAFGPPASAAETVVRYFPQGNIFEYRWKLLESALAHTQERGDATRLQAYAGEDITQSRSIRLLQRGEIDVLAFSTSPEREAQLRPIRIDILRGMLGYRVLLIRRDEQAWFSRLSERELRTRVTLGFNSQWADYDILKQNGFHLISSPDYGNLFHMLAAGRFSAFPRGLNEAWHEVDAYKGQYPSLAVESSLALFMNYPVYFWVRKDNEKLAQRIEQGLKLALADGSFKSLFLQYHRQEIAHLKHNTRRVFMLDNPQLPAGAPPADTGWWWARR